MSTSISVSRNNNDHHNNSQTYDNKYAQSLQIQLANKRSAIFLIKIQKLVKKKAKK